MNLAHCPCARFTRSRNPFTNFWFLFRRRGRKGRNPGETDREEADSPALILLQGSRFPWGNLHRDRCGAQASLLLCLEESSTKGFDT